MSDFEAITALTIIVFAVLILLYNIRGLFSKDGSSIEKKIIHVLKILTCVFIIGGFYNLLINYSETIKEVDTMQGNSKYELATLHSDIQRLSANLNNCRVSFNDIMTQYQSMYKNNQWEENDKVIVLMNEVSATKEAFYEISHENSLLQIEITKLKDKLNDTKGYTN
jgi:hypothetical protein